MSEWQPIDTAPRDGRDIMLWDPEDGEMMIAFYRESEMAPGPFGSFIWQLTCDGGVLAEQVPSHWMPLPEPPAANQLTGTANQVHMGTIK